MFYGTKACQITLSTSILKDLIAVNIFFSAVLFGGPRKQDVDDGGGGECMYYSYTLCKNE